MAKKKEALAKTKQTPRNDKMRRRRQRYKKKRRSPEHSPLKPSSRQNYESVNFGLAVETEYTDTPHMCVTCELAINKKVSTKSSSVQRDVQTCFRSLPSYLCSSTSDTHGGVSLERITVLGLYACPKYLWHAHVCYFFFFQTRKSVKQDSFAKKYHALEHKYM